MKTKKLVQAVLTASVGAIVLQSSATAQACPIVIPNPANTPDVQCRAQNETRCAGPVSPALCNQYNSYSLANGLLTNGAYSWLTANGYCAVPALFGGLAAICPMGCFEHSAELAVFDQQGEMSWVAAEDVSLDDQLAALSSYSSLFSPKLRGYDIARSSIGPEENDLYVFVLSNGNELAVTEHHVMFLSDGRALTASEVSTGDAFISTTGDDVVVDEVYRRPTSDDVFNFWIDGSSAIEHVIAAEGVLVGDLAWQVNAVGELDSIEIRRKSRLRQTAQRQSEPMQIERRSR